MVNGSAIMIKRLCGLKGQSILAQGNALGKKILKKITALKGQDKRTVHLYCPFRAKNHVSTPKTQGVALGYHTLHLRCGTNYLHPDLKTSGRVPKIKHTRPAYTLMEIMAVIAALVVLMALSVKPMRTLVLDIPRSNRDFQTLTQTMDMLEQLKKDVEQSARMTLIEMDPRISGNLLYLEQPSGLISYSLADNNVIRQSGVPNDPADNGWDLPHVRLEWAFWKNGDVPYALEITTWNERIVLNKTRQNFKQSHVYFPQTGSSNP